MFVFLRKVTGFLPGQLIAATLYAFSPYVVGNLPFGHFNIDCCSSRHTIVQFFTGPELLAMTVLVTPACVLDGPGSLPRITARGQSVDGGHLDQLPAHSNQLQPGL